MSQLILETFIKWVIPFICAGFVGWVIANAIKPISEDKANGRQLRKQKEWEDIARRSTVHESICGRYFEVIKEESKQGDKEILERLEEMQHNTSEEIHALCQSIESLHHDIGDTAKEIDAVRSGVLDAHLQNLIQSCQTFIQRGYITPSELIQYNERLAIYHKLGGNGHMDSWDNRIKVLPVHEHN